VDVYLPGCPPRPEMLLDAIVKLHDKIQNMKLGVHRERQVTELEQARLRRLPLLAGVPGTHEHRAVEQAAPDLWAAGHLAQEPAAEPEERGDLR
jgi:coenzyme F420-reducing hydrogenase gamma subunit